MTQQSLAYINVMLTVLAASGVFLALTVYWVARSLISGSASIKKLIETIDYNVHTSVDMLQRSISDINAITQRAGDQMEHVESIVSDAQQVARDARVSMRLIEETLVPVLTNLHAISAGLRKGLDTWREMNPDVNAPRQEPEEQNGA